MNPYSKYRTYLAGLCTLFLIVIIYMHYKSINKIRQLKAAQATTIVQKSSSTQDKCTANLADVIRKDKANWIQFKGQNFYYRILFAYVPSSNFSENIDVKIDKNASDSLPACIHETATAKTTPSAATAIKQLWTCFQPLDMWSRHARATSHVLTLLRDSFAQAGIDVFLDSGSLIGAVRSNTVIPWDDDIDLLFDGGKLDTTKRVLQSLAAVPANKMRYGDMMKKIGCLKLGYFCSDARSPHYTDCSIQIDLFPFTRSSHRGVNFIHRPFNRIIKASHFYPISLRPFFNTLFPVPRLPLTVLATEYSNVDRDCSRKFRKHKSYAQHCKQTKYSCSDLNVIFPHLITREYRSAGPNASLKIELLVHQNRVISVYAY